MAHTSRPNALWHNVIESIYEIQPNDYATKFGSPITMQDPRNTTDFCPILFYSKIKSVGLKSVSSWMCGKGVGDGEKMFSFDMHIGHGIIYMYWGNS